MTEFYTMRDYAEMIKDDNELLYELVEDEPYYQIARSVIQERLHRGWSQETLAHQAGITQAQVSRLETAQIGNLSTVIKVLRALDLKLEISPVVTSNQGY